MDFFDCVNLVPDYCLKKTQLCNAWVATAIVGGGALSAAATAYAANKAASTQSDAANQAALTAKYGIDASTALTTNAQKQALDIYNRSRDDTLGIYDKSRSDALNLSQPYRDIGGVAATDLTNRLGELTSPIQMDQATLEKTPGYQFNLTQGLKSVQNSAAARGLGVSGAALKGASTFATGLADSTYQNQFANAVTNQSNAYNRLKALVDTGAGASAGAAGNTTSAGAAAEGAITGAGSAAGSQYASAAGTGANAITSGASTIGGDLIGGANARAAANNSIAAGITGATNNLSGYMMYKGLLAQKNTQPINSPSNNLIS